MKITDYIIVFLLIVVVFGGITFFTINQNRSSTVVNEEYANILTIACEDTVKTANTDTIKDSVWKDELDRQVALNTFYRTLSYCINNEYTGEEIGNHLFIPSLVLIDVDGYYISYNSALDDKGNVYLGTSSAGEEYSKWLDISGSSTDINTYETDAFKEGITISPINTWTETYGDYTVRFFLNDELEVLYTDKEGITSVIKDNRENLSKEFAKLIKEGKIEADTLKGEVKNRSTAADRCSFKELLNDNKKYEEEKNYIIVKQINNEVEYYINYHNAYAESEDIPYDYTMPQISKESWHRLLKNPTSIAFMQGRQIRTGKQFTNVFAIAGGELVKQHLYFITEENGNLIYHDLYAENCPYYEIECVTDTKTVKYKGGTLGYDSTNTYDSDNSHQKWYRISRDTGIKVPITDSGEGTQDLYSSMEECARRGAYPCSCAINHNKID